jgi:hypothetical protein
MAIEEKKLSGDEQAEERQSVSEKAKKISDVFAGDNLLGSLNKDLKASKTKSGKVRARMSEPEVIPPNLPGEEKKPEVEDLEEDEDFEDDERLEDDDTDDLEDDLEEDEEEDEEEPPARKRRKPVVDEEDEEPEIVDDEGEEEDEEEERPKKPGQKRFNRMTRQLKALEAENKRLKAESDKEQDPDVGKLNTYSVAQLKQLRREIKQRMFDVMSDRDEKNLEANQKAYNRLVDLEEKAEQAMITVPQRFMRGQESRLIEAMRETADRMGAKKFDLHAAGINKIATAVFRNKASLHENPDGQAIAWEIAVEKYKAQIRGGKASKKAQRLERQANRFKKKSSLDTSVVRGTKKSVSNKKLRERARTGTYGDKTKYLSSIIEIDSFLPANLRER